MSADERPTDGPDSDFRAELLQQVHDIIRTTRISRGDVLTSEPEEIVHMTARAIADNLVSWSRDDLCDLDWYPRAATLGRDICRRLEQTTLTAKALATAKRIVMEESR